MAFAAAKIIFESRCELDKKQSRPKGEDLSVPPVFSKTFYRLLAEYAEEFAVSRAEFVMRAIRYYAKELEFRQSPMAKALGSEEAAKDYAEVQRELAKQWWANMSDEARKARTKNANAARWAKKK